MSLAPRRLHSSIDAIRRFFPFLLQLTLRHHISSNLKIEIRMGFSERKRRNFTIPILTLNNSAMPNSSIHILTTGIRLINISENHGDDTVGIGLR